MLTAYLMVLFVPVSTSSLFTAEDVLDARGLALSNWDQSAEGPTLGNLLTPRIRAALPQKASKSSSPSRRASRSNSRDAGTNAGRGPQAASRKTA